LFSFIPYNGVMSYAGVKKISPEKRFQMKSEEARAKYDGTIPSSVTSPFLFNITDNTLTDGQLSDWIWHPKEPYELSAIGLQVNNLDPETGVSPVQLAAIHRRPKSVRALFRRGADLWLNPKGWALAASFPRALPTLLEVLAVTKPFEVHIGNRFHKKPLSIRPLDTMKEWTDGDSYLEDISSPKNRAADWFELADSVIIGAATSLAGDQDSVVKFITSFMSSWSTRPSNVGSSWEDVMTRALDGLIVFWKTNPLIPFPNKPTGPRYAGAIQCLVDLGASPNMHRLVSNASQVSKTFFDSLVELFCPLTENNVTPPDPFDLDQLSNISNPVRVVMDRMRVLRVNSDQRAAQLASTILNVSALPVSDSSPAVLPVSIPGSSPVQKKEVSPLWLVDTDELPARAEAIASLLLKGIAEIDGLSSIMTCIPIGQHAILGLDKKSGAVSTAWFKSGTESLKTTTKAVLDVLPDVLDSIHMGALSAAAREWSQGGQLPWLNVFAYPGAVHDLANAPGVGSDVSSVKLLLKGWRPPVHHTIHYTKLTPVQDMDASIRGRLVARLAATSLEDTCTNIVNVFMNQAILAARPSLATALDKASKRITKAKIDIGDPVENLLVDTHPRRFDPKNSFRSPDNVATGIPPPPFMPPTRRHH
jgi:hypothetical protein